MAEIKGGVFTALATPFKDEKIDFESLEKLLDQQLKSEITGFVVAGTTGESPTLSFSEVEAQFRFVKERVGDRPVIVGTGGHCTRTSLEKSQTARDWGADAVLIVTPYYNKPTQEGICRHFAEIDKLDVPIIAYDVPARTVVRLELETVKRLSDLKNVFALKDATGDMKHHKEVVAHCDLVLLSGDDPSFPDYCSLGGHGVISVGSHIMPKAFLKILDEGLNADERADFDRVLQNLGRFSNPIPLKLALHKLGLFQSEELRLPMLALAPELADPLWSDLSRSQLLEGAL